MGAPRDYVPWMMHQFAYIYIFSMGKFILIALLLPDSYTHDFSGICGGRFFLFFWDLEYL